MWDSGPMLHDAFWHAWLTLHRISLDFIRFLCSLFRSRCALAAENLFLRKQLALYRERQVRPRRATDATRLIMVLTSRLFAWKKGGSGADRNAKVVSR
jgi:putative transposase